jgi:hypothetical protein
MLKSIKITMGSQKVPGMVVLHCDGRVYSNDYLITFKVGSLHTRTCFVNPATVGSTGRKLFMGGGF